MEIMSLQEYLEAHKEEPKASLYFSNQRQCSLCRNVCHINNLIFLMGQKIDTYGSMSMNLCRSCLSHWKEVFIKHRLVTTPDQWHWSCWNLDNPSPHTEIDRISLYLKDGQFFLQTNFNPSKRQRDMTIEEEIK
jgi:hypothetical protein